jgi:hypothetical protein
MVGDSAAGARPAATSPKAVSKATSNVVRMSDVSPISIPCQNDSEPLRWFTGHFSSEGSKDG